MSAFDGVWALELESATEMETHSGHRAVRLVWGFVGQAGHRVFDFVSMKPEAAWRLSELEAAAGLRLPGGAADVAAALGVRAGAGVRAHVVSRDTGQWGHKLQIRSYLPAGER